MARFARIWGFVAAFFAFGLLFAGGCAPANEGKTSSGPNADEVLVCLRGYEVVKAEIMPLTELICEEGGSCRLRVYVSGYDAYESKVKVPGVFRFELYERVFRSSEIKGRRVALWPDIDLREAKANNGLWRDFLRGYEFELQFDFPVDKRYVLQVTCQCPGGRRLTAEYEVVKGQ